MDYPPVHSSTWWRRSRETLEGENEQITEVEDHCICRKGSYKCTLPTNSKQPHVSVLELVKINRLLGIHHVLINTTANSYECWWMLWMNANLQYFLAGVITLLLTNSASSFTCITWDDVISSYRYCQLQVYGIALLEIKWGNGIKSQNVKVSVL